VAFEENTHAFVNIAHRSEARNATANVGTRMSGHRTRSRASILAQRDVPKLNLTGFKDRFLSR